MEKKTFYMLEERLNYLLENDGTHEGDLERKALFYILAANSDLYSKVHHIYDFEKHSIKVACLESEDVDFCSSSRALVKLGFNLYNGYPADVLKTLSVLDEGNFKAALEAMKIRCNKF